MSLGGVESRPHFSMQFFAVMPDKEKIDHILQYALLVAAQGDWHEQALSPIHLVKYL